MNLNPQPLLSAIYNFSGSITDLDLDVTIEPDEFNRMRYSLAQRLEIEGLRPGDRVIFAVQNGARFLVAFTAVLATGASPLLLHYETPPAELKRLAIRYGAKFVFCDGWSAFELQAIAASVQKVETAPWARWFLAEMEVPESSDEPFPSLPGVSLHPTSGTSGVPKIAVRPALATIAEAMQYIQTIGIVRGDTILATVPMSHSYGFGMCAMVPLLSGANIVSMRSFNPKLVQRALLENNISIFPAVPAMLDILSKGTGSTRFDRPIQVFSAGSAVSEPIASQFEEQYGAGVRSLYGSTETGGISVALSPGRGQDVSAVGRPFQGVRVELDTSGIEENPNEQVVGCLRVSSDALMSGYLVPGGIDSSMLENGWYNTGDFASIDEQGIIRLKGRNSDVINIFGMKVLPYEVEAVIKGLPKVKEVIVYRGLHRSGSQLVKAAIIPHTSLDAAEVRSYCERNLAPYKRPQIITFLDEFPRGPSGKVVRHYLP